MPGPQPVHRTDGNARIEIGETAKGGPSLKNVPGLAPRNTPASLGERPLPNEVNPPRK